MYAFTLEKCMIADLINLLFHVVVVLPHVTVHNVQVFCVMCKSWHTDSCDMCNVQIY